MNQVADLITAIACPVLDNSYLGITTDFTFHQ